MLVVRKEQLRALADLDWARFEQQAVEHCRQAFPAICDSLGEDATKQQVHLGLRQAKGHGFESAADLLGYLNLVFTFGPDFQERPWASEVLRDRSFAPSVRIGLLTDYALDELKGPAAQPDEREPEPAEDLSDDEPIPADPFAAWEEAPPAPVPPDPAPLPPSGSALPPRPPDFVRSDEHFAW